MRERGIGVRRQTEIYVSGLAGRRPTVPVDPGRLEWAARRKMSREGFAYVAGGAGNESNVYGLALTGERGVAEVVENVLAELDLSMSLAG